MMTMEELQKACETLVEAWNKALEPMEELQKSRETLTEAWNKALEPMEKLAKALSDAFGRMYGSEEKTRKIRTGWKHKSVKRVPDSKMSTYNYKPAMKRNLPYQRRNF